MGQLIGALIVCMIALVPNDSTIALGVIIALVGLALWIFQTRLQLRAAVPKQLRPRSSIALAQLATVPFILGGVSMTIRAFGGLYWIAAGA
ncbi:MAG TPA: hypothetical protein VKR29_10965, partial [Candidatus Binataceae bacterium]|nr:hypothetical protein [Candidatus Binataceae bacterium]